MGRCRFCGVKSPRVNYPFGRKSKGFGAPTKHRSYCKTLEKKSSP